MDYTLETMDAFPVIGFECSCSMDDSFTHLPRFWSEIRTKYERFMNGTGQPMNEIEQVISDCHIGEFGVCIDDESTEICRYLLGGRYDGGCRLIPNFPPDMQERDNSREFVLF